MLSQRARYPPLQIPQTTNVNAVPYRALPTVPQTSAGDRVYVHRQGKALGGSSAINGAVYLRPDVREFEAYEALGAKGWCVAWLLVSMNQLTFMMRASAA